MTFALARPIPLLLAGGLLLACGAGQAAVFVNEVHYDNAGSDSGERVEIVATDGESLSGYRVYLYNGGGSPGSASVYGSTAVPPGSVSSCGGSVRIATIAYARDGLQNGPNDAMALVDAGGQVVQFLGYEGSVTGGSGPAAGMTSDSLPVAENSDTPAGTSLQLRGNGSGYGDFSWAASSTQSFGACNAGQGFSGGGNPAPLLVSTTPADGATGFPAAGDLEVVFNEVVSAASGAFALACDVSGTVALSHAASGGSFTLATGTALHGGEHCVLSIDATRISDDGGAHAGSGASIGFDVADGGGGGGTTITTRTSTRAAPSSCAARCTRRSVATPSIRTAAAAPAPGRSWKSPTRIRTTRDASSTPIATAATPRAPTAPGPAPD